MPPLLSTLTSRLTLSAALGQSSLARAAPTAAFHLAALAVMAWSEIGAVPLGILIWRADPFRVRRRTAMAGGAACLVALAGLEFAFPFLEGESFGDDNYVSSFARSGVGAVSEFTTHGFLESDAAVNDQL